MSAKRKVLVTYFFNMLEFATSFLSMLIVTPKITGTLSPQVYGTYVAVLGFLVFLGYTDFGFLKAADKFGCDEYIRGNKRKEVEIISSACFVQFLSLLVLASFFILFAWRPEMVLSGLDPDSQRVSRMLFLLSAVFLLSVIPRQVVNTISRYRIEMYRVSRWLILANLFNIAMVYVVFRSNKSMEIVYYYAIANSVTSATVVAVLVYLLRKWDYSLKLFLSNFKFNGSVLRALWPFSSASLVAMGTWILYYELDSVFIAKFISVRALAYYGIAATLMAFFRRLSSTLLAPYVPKYNEYYVNDDDTGMKEFYLSNLAVVAPVLFIPTVVSIILMPQVIVAWVGKGFVPSILAAQFLVGVWLLSPVKDVPVLILTAKVKVKLIYGSALVAPVVFWVLVFAFTKEYGIYAVAGSKLVATLINVVYIIYVSHKLIGLKFAEYAKRILVPSFASILLAVALCLPFTSMSVVKSKLDLLLVIGIGGLIGGLAFAVYVLLSEQFRVAIGKDYFTIRKWKSLLSFTTDESAPSL